MVKSKRRTKTKISKRPKKALKVKRASRAKAVRKPKKMARRDLAKYKEMLIKEREKAGGDLSHLTQNTLNKSQRDSSGDLSGYSYHMADMASDDYERDFSLGRATDEQKRLYAIDEAMKRIKDGTYGSCLQCTKPIAKRRLAAVPHAELCIDCQKMNEAK